MNNGYNSIDRARIADHLRMYTFALVEANLYLDTHPDCEEALEYYRKTKELYEKAAKDYRENVGPLFASDVAYNRRWNWVDSPWPWEKESL